MIITEQQIAQLNARYGTARAARGPRPAAALISFLHSLGARLRRRAVEKIVYVVRAPLDEAALRGALTVADDSAWWRAVHQVIDEMEAETTTSARDSTLQPNLCAAHVAAGEGLDLLRKRLVRLRREGIEGKG